MTTATLEQTVSETEAQAMRRLLAKAREEGVQIKRDAEGAYWATSTSHPGTLYAVTGYSCTCKGFMGHQRCKHLAALMAALGWLTEPTPDPVPTMTVEVVHAPGGYEDAGWLVRSGVPVWRESATTIRIDGQDWVTIRGDFNCRVQMWDGEDMSETFPSGLDHHECVEHWILAADDNLVPHMLMQDAGLFPADEFVDAEPVAA